MKFIYGLLMVGLCSGGIRYPVGVSNIIIYHEYHISYILMFKFFIARVTTFLVCIFYLLSEKAWIRFEGKKRLKIILFIEKKGLIQFGCELVLFTRVQAPVVVPTFYFIISWSEHLSVSTFYIIISGSEHLSVPTFYFIISGSEHLSVPTFILWYQGPSTCQYLLFTL